MENEKRLPYDLQMRSLKDFTLIGFALLAYISISHLAALGIDRLTESLLPAVADSSWFGLGLSIVAIHMVALPIVMLILKRVPVGDAIGPCRSDINLERFGMFAIVSFAAMYLSTMITVVFYAELSPTGGLPENPVGEVMLDAGMLPTLIFGVIIGPIMEEITFRGILLKRLRRWGDIPAIIISGVCFGLFHCTINQFLYAASVGMIFAYTVLRYGTLKYAVLLHMLINAVGGLVMPVIVTSDNIFAIGLAGLSIIALVIGGIIVAFVNRHYREFYGTEEPAWRTILRFFVTPGSLGFIAVCIFFTVLNML